MVYARVEYDRVILSEDGGQRWRSFDAGLEARTVFSLYAAPRTADLYAGTDQGLYRFNEVLNRWEPTGGKLPPGTVLSVVADPRDAARVWIGHTAGIFASSDGGRSWSGPLPGLNDRTVRAIALDLPWIYVGTQQDGVFISKDEGKTWRKLGRLPGGVAINQLVVERFSSDLYAATDVGLFRWPAGQH
jgi:ligand-binding sensor domain-containing protein